MAEFNILSVTSVDVQSRKNQVESREEREKSMEQ